MGKQPLIMSTSSLVACRWDWCRSTFSSIDALDTHVKHDHIWPMKPMRKAEIALMRRMDLQSLHSSLDSSIISKDLITGVLRTSTPLANLSPPPPRTRTLSDSEEFDTFPQLSSPPQIRSPDKLPVSSALESVLKQNGHAGLSAAAQTFERTHRLKANRSPRLPSHLRSLVWRPRSDSSGSSQAIEHQLTQEDSLASQSSLAPELQIENGPTNTEARPPADDRTDAPTSKEIQSPEPPDSEQNLRCRSLNVPLSVNSPRSSMNLEDASQGSIIISQPLMSQANVSYSSQP